MARCCASGDARFTPASFQKNDDKTENEIARVGALDIVGLRLACTWHHWATHDIPPTVTELAEGAAQNKKMKQAVNDFRKPGYGGPLSSATSEFPKKQMNLRE
jgi:hypothetical protein